MNRDNIWEKYYKSDQNVARDNSNWTSFSVMMPIDNGMRFVGYNCSHLLDSGKQVHRGTRIQLIIPKDLMVCLVFHGRFVHSGAAQTDNQEDYRWFSYVEKIDINKRVKRNRKDAGLSKGVIHRDTFKLCDSDCELCKNSEEVNIDLNDLVVNEGCGIYKGMYGDQKKVFGNLNDLGWELHFGRSLKENEEYFIAIEKLKGNILKEENEGLWKGISNTRRQAFKFDELQNKDYGEKKMMEIVSNLIERCLGQIELEGSSLLRNKKISSSGSCLLEEQEPHRDYSTNT